MRKVYKITSIAWGSCAECGKTRPDVLGRFKGFRGGSIKSEFKNRQVSADGDAFGSGVSISDCALCTCRNLYNGSDFVGGFSRLYTASLSDYFRIAFAYMAQLCTRPIERPYAHPCYAKNRIRTHQISIGPQVRRVCLYFGRQYSISSVGGCMFSLWR